MFSTPCRANYWRPVLGLCLLSLCACRSAAEHAADADRQTYSIVDAARQSLGASEPMRLSSIPVYGSDGPGDAQGGILRNQLLGDPGSGRIRSLSLGACLRIAAENSREFEDRREALYLSALSLTRTQWEFGYQQAAGGAGFLSGDADDAGPVEGNAFLTVSRLFASGARFVGSSALSLTRDLSTGDAWSAFSDLSLGLTQPLLRGFGKEIVLEPLVQAERDVLYEARRYERFRRTFAFDVASRYYRIVQSMDLLRNEQANRESLVLLGKRNREFAQAGLLSDIQVDQALQDEFRAENRVIDALRDLEASLDSYKLFLGLPVEVEMGVDLEAIDPLIVLLEKLELDLDSNLSMAVALAERLDHRTNLEQVEDAQRRTEVAADALRMGLDLSVDAAISSEENALLDFRGKNFSWSAALNLDLPIDLIPERNVYRQSLIRLEASERTAEESRDNVIADVRAAQRQLDAARATLEIQTRAVSLAERRVESATLNLEAGRADTRDLLESQEDLLEAQNSQARAKTDFALAALALYRDMELLRVEDSVVVVDAAPLERERLAGKGAGNRSADEGMPQVQADESEAREGESDE